MLSSREDEPAKNNETNGSPISHTSKIVSVTTVQRYVWCDTYDYSASIMSCGQLQVSMMVVWHQDICNHHDDLGRSMMTSSNGNIFRVTGHLCGEFTGTRWILRTKASDAELWFYYLRPNKLLSKQSWGWWFETPSCPLWRHRNAVRLRSPSSLMY